MTFCELTDKYNDRIITVDRSQSWPEETEIMITVDEDCLDCLSIMLSDDKIRVLIEALKNALAQNWEAGR